MEIDHIRCMECGDAIHVDVYEYDSETGIPTQFGFHHSCKENILEDNCNRSYEDNIDIALEAFIYMRKNRVSFKQ